VNFQKFKLNQMATRRTSKGQKQIFDQIVKEFASNAYISTNSQMLIALNQVSFAKNFD